MENIGKYLKFCEEQLGVQKGDQFQTVDLYEKQNMANVSKPCVTINCFKYNQNSGMSLHVHHANSYVVHVLTKWNLSVLKFKFLFLLFT